MKKSIRTNGKIIAASKIPDRYFLLLRHSICPYRFFHFSVFDKLRVGGFSQLSSACSDILSDPIDFFIFLSLIN